MKWEGSRAADGAAEMSTRTCTPLVVLLAIAQTAAAQGVHSSGKASHIEARLLDDAELTAYGTLDQAVRAKNEKLVFDLLNLTGTTFRMWYCGQPAFEDKLILEHILETAHLRQEQLSLFRRWYAAEMRFSGHNAAVWRKMAVERQMRSVECTEDKLASSRGWIASHSSNTPDE